MSGVGGLQLTGTASIAEDIDKKMLVVLRDGRKIVGTLRTFDQFSNVVLEHALERIIVGRCFADVPLGLYVVRGENIVLLGQVDDAKEQYTTEELLTRVEVEDILEAKKEEEEQKRLKAQISRTKATVNEFGEDLFS
jgi:U6 snRNA-associated Sm-like protein LSm1